MRLEKKPPGGHPPLRTVTELAEMLGVAVSQLTHALQHESAPKHKLHWKDAGHHLHKRIWYDPKEVIPWFRNFVGSAADKGAVKRKYYQEYRAKRKEMEGK